MFLKTGICFCCKLLSLNNQMASFRGIFRSIKERSKEKIDCSAILNTLDERLFENLPNYFADMIKRNAYNRRWRRLAVSTF